MLKQLADHFRAVRFAKGLSLEDLARLAGADNQRKVAHRIARFERDGRIKDELLSRLADALSIEYPTIEALLAHEGQEPLSFALQRKDGRYLTPGYLRWSEALQAAQRCDVSEAIAIQVWLQGIGIQVTLRPASEAPERNFAEWPNPEIESLNS